MTNGQPTKDRLIEAIYSAIPYPAQITALDTTSEPNAIRFSWRSSRYRCTLSGHVEKSVDGLLVGSDTAILMQALIATQAVRLIGIVGEAA